MKPIKHEVYEGMFYAVYPDGTPSKDFYNYTWAYDHTQVIAENETRRPGIGPTEAADAFK